jgi:hypothetical protein
MGSREALFLEKTHGQYTALRYIRTVLEIISMLGVIALAVIFALTAGAPDIPDAPDSDGLVGLYGMRVVLTGIFLSGALPTGLVFLIARFPRLQRFPVEINAGNVEIQYILLKIMLSAEQIVLINYFAAMMISVYRSAIELDSPGFLQTTLVAGFACLAIWIFYYIAARRNKNE